MARRKPVTIEEVFEVMAKHNFNVKAASQELQIKKTRIYNIKSKQKEEWQKLLDQHNQKEGHDMLKESSLKKVSDKKFKPIPTVKSGIAERHVGVTRSISDESSKSENTSKLSKDLYAENIKLDKKVKDLMEVNEEIAGALNRANEEKEAIGKEFNNLVDDFNEVKAELKMLKAQGNTELLEVEETVYTVKLGKMFVTADYKLYGHHSAAQFKDLGNAKEISDEVGGLLYKAVLMPVESEE